MPENRDEKSTANDADLKGKSPDIAGGLGRDQNQAMSENVTDSPKPQNDDDIESEFTLRDIINGTTPVLVGEQRAQLAQYVEAARTAWSANRDLFFRNAQERSIGGSDSALLNAKNRAEYTLRTGRVPTGYDPQLASGYLEESRRRGQPGSFDKEFLDRKYSRKLIKEIGKELDTFNALSSDAGLRPPDWMNALLIQPAEGMFAALGNFGTGVLNVATEPLGLGKFEYSPVFAGYGKSLAESDSKFWQAAGSMAETVGSLIPQLALAGGVGAGRNLAAKALTGRGAQTAARTAQEAVSFADKFKTYAAATAKNAFDLGVASGLTAPEGYRAQAALENAVMTGVGTAMVAPFKPIIWKAKAPPSIKAMTDMLLEGASNVASDAIFQPILSGRDMTTEDKVSSFILGSAMAAPEALSMRRSLKAEKYLKDASDALAKDSSFGNIVKQTMLLSNDIIGEWTPLLDKRGDRVKPGIEVRPEHINGMREYLTLATGEVPTDDMVMDAIARLTTKEGAEAAADTTVRLIAELSDSPARVNPEMVDVIHQSRMAFLDFISSSQGRDALEISKAMRDVSDEVRTRALEDTLTVGDEIDAEYPSMQRRREPATREEIEGAVKFLSGEGTYTPEEIRNFSRIIGQYGSGEKRGGRRYGAVIESKLADVIGDPEAVKRRMDKIRETNPDAIQEVSLALIEAAKTDAGSRVSPVEKRAKPDVPESGSVADKYSSVRSERAQARYTELINQGMAPRFARDIADIDARIASGDQIIKDYFAGDISLEDRARKVRAARSRLVAKKAQIEEASRREGSREVFAEGEKVSGEGLPRAQQQVLDSVRRIVEADPNAVPTNADIARDIGISRATVGQHIQALRRKGMLEMGRNVLTERAKERRPMTAAEADAAAASDVAAAGVGYSPRDVVDALVNADDPNSPRMSVEDREYAAKILDEVASSRPELERVAKIASAALRSDKPISALRDAFKADPKLRSQFNSALNAGDLIYDKRSVVRPGEADEAAVAAKAEIAADVEAGMGRGDARFAKAAADEAMDVGRNLGVDSDVAADLGTIIGRPGRPISESIGSVKPGSPEYAREYSRILESSLREANSRAGMSADQADAVARFEAARAALDHLEVGDSPAIKAAEARHTAEMQAARKRINELFPNGYDPIPSHGGDGLAKRGLASDVTIRTMADGALRADASRGEDTDAARRFGADSTGQFRLFSARERPNARARLEKAARDLKDGRIDIDQYMRIVDDITGDLRRLSAEKMQKEFNRRWGDGLERGREIVLEKLYAALRRGELSKEYVAFLEWSMNQSERFADHLAISIRADRDEIFGSDVAGVYIPSMAMAMLRKGSDIAAVVGVHEILGHHAERMLPPEIAKKVVEAWRRSYEDAVRNTEEGSKEREALLLIPSAMLGDKKAFEGLRKAFFEGTLDYDRHYQLVNPSEYWAVNVADILKARFDAKDSWVKRAGVWGAEFLTKVKSFFGASNNAAAIRAIDALLKGTSDKSMKSGKGERFQFNPDRPMLYETKEARQFAEGRVAEKMRGPQLLDSDPNALGAWLRRKTGKPIDEKMAKAVSIDSAIDFVRNNKFASHFQFRKALQKMIRDQFAAGGRRISPNTRDEVFRNFVKSAVRYEIERAAGKSGNASGWYKQKIAVANAIVATVHPELSSDPDARGVFNMILAITSNGQKVDRNFENAEEIYAKFKENGRSGIPIGMMSGTQAGAGEEAFRLINILANREGNGDFMAGIAKVREFFSSKHTVAEIEQFVNNSIELVSKKRKGKNKLKPYKIKTTMDGSSNPQYGSLILGPKIGAFFQNIIGNSDVFTIDRWNYRTWGRLTGALIVPNKQAAGRAVDRLRDVLDVIDQPAKARLISIFKVHSKGRSRDKDIRIVESLLSSQSPLSKSQLERLSGIVSRLASRSPEFRAALKEDGYMDDLRGRTIDPKAGREYAKSIGAREVDAAAFIKQLSKNIDESDRGLFVTKIEHESELTGARMFIGPNGETVYVSADGEIAGASKPKGSTYKGWAEAAFRLGFELGGYKASSFDRPGTSEKGLPDIYSKLGMRVVARMKFDPKYAPPGWDYARDGQPDVVFYSRIGKEGDTYKPGQGDYITDYAEAGGIQRDAMLRHIGGEGMGRAAEIRKQLEDKWRKSAAEGDDDPESNKAAASAKSSLFDLIRLASNSYAKNIKGDVDAPSGNDERLEITSVYSEVVDEMRRDPRYADMTYDESQALIWYPEKLLYESSGMPVGKIKESYSAEELPDFAKAAEKLAVKRGVNKEVIDEASKRASDEYAAGLSGRGGRRGPDGRGDAGLAGLGRGADQGVPVSDLAVRDERASAEAEQTGVTEPVSPEARAGAATEAGIGRAAEAGPASRAGTGQGPTPDVMGGMPGAMPSMQRRREAEVYKPPEAGFRQNVEDALSTIKGSRATADQIRAAIGKVSGAKEQAKFIGLDDFLKDKTDVSMDEVRQYVRNNIFSVEEVTGGETNPIFERYSTPGGQAYSEIRFVGSGNVIRPSDSHAKRVQEYERRVAEQEKTVLESERLFNESLHIYSGLLDEFYQKSIKPFYEFIARRDPDSEDITSWSAPQWNAGRILGLTLSNNKYRMLTTKEKGAVIDALARLYYMQSTALRDVFNRQINKMAEEDLRSIFKSDTPIRLTDEGRSKMTERLAQDYSIDQNYEYLLSKMGFSIDSIPDKIKEQAKSAQGGSVDMLDWLVGDALPIFEEFTNWRNSSRIDKTKIMRDFLFYSNGALRDSLDAFRSDDQLLSEAGLLELRNSYEEARRDYEQKGYDSDKAREDLQEIKSAVILDTTSEFMGSHWSEPNVLAHARIKTYFEDGSKILLVDEVQSDWQQTGREFGFFGQRDAANARLDELRDAANTRGLTTEEADERRSLMSKNFNVPDFPIKNWPMTVMRRLFQYAAENGYDSVAVTKGKTHAARYNLADQVEQISRSHGEQTLRRNEYGERKLYKIYSVLVKPANGSPEIMLDVDVETNKVLRSTDPRFEDKPLSQIVGAEVARKLSGDNITYVLEGDDLKNLSLSGMRGFYDVKLRNELDMWLRKFGAKSEDALLSVPEPGGGVEGSEAPVYKVAIPPQMRDAVKGGVPLFSMGPRAGGGMGRGGGTPPPSSPSATPGGLPDPERSIFGATRDATGRVAKEVSDTFKRMSRAIANHGGDVGRKIAARLDGIPNSYRKFSGMLSEALSEARKATGIYGFKMGGALSSERSAARKMSRITRVSGENYARMPDYVGAVEGKIDLNTLPESERRIVEAVIKVASETLRVARDAGLMRFNEVKDMLELVGESERAQQGRVFRRVPLKGLNEILSAGESHHLFNRLVNAFAKENPDMSIDDVKSLLLRQSREQAQARAMQNQLMPGDVKPGERQTALEFYREFKNVPAAIYNDFGVPIRLFEVDPAKWVEAVIHKTSMRLAFVENVGQDMPIDPVTKQLIPGQESPVEKMRADYAAAGGPLPMLDEAIAGAQGKPIVPGNPKPDMFERGARAIVSVINGPFKLLKITASPFYNLIEPLGATRSAAGIVSTTKSWAKTFGYNMSLLTGGKFFKGLQAEVEALEKVGAIDPRGEYKLTDPIGSQRSVEITAALAMKDAVDRMKARAGATPDSFIGSMRYNDDVQRLKQFFGYNTEYARKIASGRGTPEQYDALLRGVVPAATGGRMLPIEKSRIENKQWFKDMYAIATYAGRQMALLARTVTSVLGSLKPGNRDQVLAATRRFGSEVVGSTGYGLASNLLFGLLMGGTAAVQQILSDLEEDPVGESLKAALNTKVSGPYAGVGQALIDEDRDFVSTIFFISMYKDVEDFVMSFVSDDEGGRYRGLELGDRVNDFLSNTMPMYRIAKRGWHAAASILGDDNISPRLIDAKKQFRKWKRDSNIRSTYGGISNETADDITAQNAMIRFRRGVDDRDSDDKLLGYLEEAFNVRGAESVAQTILSYRALYDLTPDQHDSLARSIGPENYDLLVMEDAFYEEIARGLGTKVKETTPEEREMKREEARVKRMADIFPEEDVRAAVSQMNRGGLGRGR